MLHPGSGAPMPSRRRPASNSKFPKTIVKDSKSQHESDGSRKHGRATPSQPHPNRSLAFSVPFEGSPDGPASESALCGDNS